MSSIKPKPIPIRDFIFEGLTDRSELKTSGYFPKKNIKQVFQMPRTLPRKKKLIIRSQKQIRINESIQDNEKKLSTHLNASKAPPSMVFHTINNYLMLKKQERNSFEQPTPSYRSLPKTPSLKSVIQRPKTSNVSVGRVRSEELLTVKRRSIEKKPEKISVYLKSPDIDYSEFDDF